VINAQQRAPDDRPPNAKESNAIAAAGDAPTRAWRISMSRSRNHRTNQRRYRARRRNGIRMVSVEVTTDILDLLMRTWWLTIEHSDNNAHIKAALQAMLDASAKKL
jgi:hypothetical protein